MLEGAIELDETGDVGRQGNRVEAKNQAMDFIHEMGWLLHRSHVKFRLGHLDPNSSPFPFGRFRQLMEFSMEHDWCFVVKKLLGILFEGTVDAGEHPSIEVAILDMGLLHRAVRRNCRPMVELLLKFVPHKARDEQGSEESQEVDKGSGSFLFKPDVGGPMGLTPLHVAASQDACESVVDALTDDPGKVFYLLLFILDKKRDFTKKDKLQRKITLVFRTKSSQRKIHKRPIKLKIKKTRQHTSNLRWLQIAGSS